MSNDILTSTASTLSNRESGSAKANLIHAIRWLKRVMSAVRAHRARRRVLADLASMPAFVLRDIGVTPFEIQEVRRTRNVFVRRAMRQVLRRPGSSAPRINSARRTGSGGALWTS